MKNQAYPYYILPQIDNLREMVLRQELERPDEIAFKYKKKKELYEKTFGQFKADIDRIGAKFLELGLAGKHIGIIGGNSYEWIVAFLAAVNGGMVAAPIAKEYSPAEACELLKRSDCSAVVYSVSYSKFMKHEDFPADMVTVATKEIAALIKDIDEDYPFKDEYQNIELDNEKLAAIFFTSGTTGSSIEEVVIFVEDNKLVCEIFPSEDHVDDFDHIKKVVHEFNKTQPAYRQIAKVYLRSTEFEKNANKKLMRFKVTEAHQKN